MNQKPGSPLGNSNQPVKLQLMPPDYKDDEISLYDIWHILVCFKSHIAAITLMCTLAALVYALLAPPLYQAEAYLLPPRSSDINGLNVDGNEYLPDQVYSDFLRNFRANWIRSKFFKEYNLARVLTDENLPDVNQHELYERKFNDLLYLGIGEVDKAYFQASKAELAAEWLNKFVDFVNNETVTLLKRDIKRELDSDKRQIMEQVELKRQTAEKQKMDIQIILEEAHEIADKAGITEVPLFTAATSFGANERAVDPRQSPLYSRGTIALSQEIEALKNRKNNDPFINGLRGFEERIIRYETLLKQLDSDTSIKAVIVDQYATIPEYRIEPKRKQIVIVGVILGLFIGVLFVFILNFFTKARKQTEQE